jgi:hypothetical protein
MNANPAGRMHCLSYQSAHSRYNTTLEQVEEGSIPLLFICLIVAHQWPLAESLQELGDNVRELRPLDIIASTSLMFIEQLRPTTSDNQ